MTFLLPQNRFFYYFAYLDWVFFSKEIIFFSNSHIFWHYNLMIWLLLFFTFTKETSKIKAFCNFSSRVEKFLWDTRQEHACRSPKASDGRKTRHKKRKFIHIFYFNHILFKISFAFVLRWHFQWILRYFAQIDFRLQHCIGCCGVIKYSFITVTD